MGLLDQLKNAGSAIIGDVLQQNTTEEQSNVQTPVQQVPAPSSTGLYNPQLEKLIDLALADGVLTEKEKQVLFKKAESMGIDLDEFEMVLDAKLYEQSQRQQSTVVNQAAPTSNKFGDVKKCPLCGAMIQSFTTHCPECGFEFRNVDANSTIQHLFDLLNNVMVKAQENKNKQSGINRFFADMEDDAMNQKITIIRNFPIPNTKEDIIEFLTLAFPLAKKPGFFKLNNDSEKECLQPIWKDKCEQIIMKARFSMKDDPETLAEINTYGKKLGIK